MNNQFRPVRFLSDKPFISVILLGDSMEFQQKLLLRTEMGNAIVMEVRDIPSEEIAFCDSVRWMCILL